jgi:hypothetical protein
VDGVRCQPVGQSCHEPLHVGAAHRRQRPVAELRGKVERILGWNAEKAVSIPDVFADRLTKAARLIADTRRA